MHCVAVVVVENKQVIAAGTRRNDESAGLIGEYFASTSVPNSGAAPVRGFAIGRWLWGQVGHFVGG